MSNRHDGTNSRTEQRLLNEAAIIDALPGTADEIACKTGIHKSTTHSALKRMEFAGHVNATSIFDKAMGQRPISRWAIGPAADWVASEKMKVIEAVRPIHRFPLGYKPGPFDALFPPP